MHSIFQSAERMSKTTDHKYSSKAILKIWKSSSKLFVVKSIVTQLKFIRGGSRTAATSKMEPFVTPVNVNYYHKALHLGCCSSPRSPSAYT